MTLFRWLRAIFLFGRSLSQQCAIGSASPGVPEKIDLLKQKSGITSHRHREIFGRAQRLLLREDAENVGGGLCSRRQIKTPLTAALLANVRTISWVGQHDGI